MRRIVTLLALFTLDLPGAVHAQGQNSGIIEKVVWAGQAEDGDSFGMVMAVVRVSGCKVILPVFTPAEIEDAVEFVPAESSWTGSCNAQGLLQGNGVLTITSLVDGSLLSETMNGNFVNGLSQGLVSNSDSFGNQRDENHTNGCAKENWFGDARLNKECNSAALRMQARYLVAEGASKPAALIASQSAGPLPTGRRWGNSCLKIEKLQRNRFPQETGKIFDAINFVLRNDCPTDQLYYLSFGGPESNYVSSNFTNRKFQQEEMAAANSAFLPDPVREDFLPLLRQPPAHTPNAQGFVQVARAGKSYHMEVSAGEADSMTASYWSPRQYVIAACDATSGGYTVKMFFNPGRDYFECIPKTNGSAR